MSVQVLSEYATFHSKQSILHSDASLCTLKFEARLGARTSWGESSDLRSEVELGYLRSLGSENRVISRVISLRFVGSSFISVALYAMSI
jgi:hypothetical protein